MLLQVQNGGTGAPTAAGARINLGLGPSSSPTFTNLTLTGNLSVGGTLGVTGATTLNVTTTGALTVGATIYRGVNDNTLHISGGTDYQNGGAVILRGGTHATEANDIIFNSENVSVYRYDRSTLTHTFGGGATTVTGAFTSLGIDDNATAERIQISDTSIALGSTSAAATYGLHNQFNSGKIIIAGGIDLTSGALIDLSGGATAGTANDIVFKTAGTTRYEWDNSALTHTFSGGPIVLGSGQITFPATQNPSASANVLDDYEEGTWTPACAFDTPGTSSFAYTTQEAIYVKVGKLVFLRCRVVFTPTIGTGTGLFNITGLPFTCASTPTFVGGGGSITNMTSTFTWPASITNVSIGVRSSDTRAVIQGVGSAVASQNFTQTTLTDAASHTIVFSVVYESSG